MTEHYLARNYKRTKVKGTGHQLSKGVL
jgi:hypothetical protein